jgi:FkbM family methyltransferase
MDLAFNSVAQFTRWVVKTGGLHEPFVLVDVGVQGGENPRWHILGDFLVVHGLDAIEEVVASLRLANPENPKRQYHFIAAGDVDEERTLFFNSADPFSSSLVQQGGDRFSGDGSRTDSRREVKVRRLDTLLAEGTLPRPDFVKIDVEGFEQNVLLGAAEFLRSALGAELESNFNVSPTYPDSHLGTLQRLLLKNHLLVFDINFNRVPRAAFQEALARKNLPPVVDQQSVGRPATLNVLFCRNAIDDVDYASNYATPSEPLSVDQLLKLAVIYELYGLNDIAIDTLGRFREDLATRLDVDYAINLLADPHCRLASGAQQPVSPQDVGVLDLTAPGRAKSLYRFRAGLRLGYYRASARLRALRRLLPR